MLLVLLVLVLWPARFTLEAKGTLEPVERQDVFAGIDGVVEDLNVAHGDKVAKDQLLVKLRNTDLDVAIDDVQGKRLADQRAVGADPAGIARGREDAAASRSGIRLAGEQAELKQKLISPRTTSWRSTRRSSWNWTSRAPSTAWWSPGTCGTGCRSIGRCSGARCCCAWPIPTAPWQLELHMPENHMGHVAEHSRRSTSKSREKLRELAAGRTPRPSSDDAAAEEDVDQGGGGGTGQSARRGVARQDRRDLSSSGFARALEPILKDVTDEKLRAKLGDGAARADVRRRPAKAGRSC